MGVTVDRRVGCCVLIALVLCEWCDCCACNSAHSCSCCAAAVKITSVKISGHVRRELWLKFNEGKMDQNSAP